jgi:PAS domain-containing protein
MFETATPTRRDPSVPPGTADAGARLAHVLDACGCGLLQVGPDWRIRLVNRAIEEMYASAGTN